MSVQKISVISSPPHRAPARARPPCLPTPDSSWVQLIGPDHKPVKFSCGDLKWNGLKCRFRMELVTMVGTERKVTEFSPWHAKPRELQRKTMTRGRAAAEGEEKGEAVALSVPVRLGCPLASGFHESSLPINPFSLETSVPLAPLQDSSVWDPPIGGKRLPKAIPIGFL